MHVQTLRYDPSSGWSEPFPDTDSEQTLVVVFGGAGYLDEPAPVAQLCGAYPRSVVIGCSTAGEICGDRLHDDSLVAAVASFGRTGLALAAAPVSDAGASFEAGRALARQLDADDLRAVFVLCDGLGVNGSTLAAGVNSVLDPRVVVTGGLAGDADRFERTWVVHQGKPAGGWATAVGFYGNDVLYGHGSRGGWDIFGPERTVTGSEGNVLYELDGIPALDLYETYLGDRADDLPGSALLFPLSLRSGASDPNSFVRTILAVDHSARSMTFAGDVPTGYRAQLMRANFDRLVDGAGEAAELGIAAAAGGEQGETLVLAISCVGRRLVLGERTEDEIEATLDAVGPNATQLGFYSYGELSPLTDGTCDLHNQTMTITTISEA